MRRSFSPSHGERQLANSGFAAAGLPSCEVHSSNSWLNTTTSVLLAPPSRTCVESRPSSSHRRCHGAAPTRASLALSRARWSIPGRRSDPTKNSPISASAGLRYPRGL
jgi:hypothetical protein